MRRAFHQALRLLGYVWSLPYALVGFVVAWVFLTLQWIAFAEVRDGALELTCKGPLARWLTGRNWRAFTLGWTVFFWATPHEALRRHEHRHVSQALVLGVLYPAAYLVALLLQGYRSSVFEVDARRAAGQLPQPAEQRQ